MGEGGRGEAGGRKARTTLGSGGRGAYSGREWTEPTDGVERRSLRREGVDGAHGWGGETESTEGKGVDGTYRVKGVDGAHC